LIKKRNQIIESLYSIPFEIIPDVYLNKIIRDKIWSRTYFLFIVLSFLIVCLNYFVFIRTSTSDPFIMLSNDYQSKLHALEQPHLTLIDLSRVFLNDTESYSDKSEFFRFVSISNRNIVGTQTDIGCNCCCCHF
jgi:hypothetical protein